VAYYIDEKFSRVEIYLPFADKDEKAAGNAFIDYLKNERLSNGKPRYPGFTYSSPYYHSLYIGFWWDEERKDEHNNPAPAWVMDRLVILTLDLNIPYTDPLDPDKLKSEVAKLRREMEDRYKKYDTEQKDVWVVIHPINLLKEQKTSGP
jgi:hypothetical protein